ncbi:FCS-Like Zinc finger 8-like [Diospyros lotus]|uniref:FCS-Like Zinc finger 8-like n=1 Tax=Diospyros lotus TaxID=55363 RepID=UPI0022512E9E|nr:FCS-Like Zinc finger 8-like [Diospyros lotus]
MLRNRSRAVTGKQTLMADHTSLSSPSQNRTRPNSSFFGSPRFFSGLQPKAPSEIETVSPTSILDSKQFPYHPFGYDKSQSKLSINFSGNEHSRDKPDPKGVGLALVDSLNDQTPDDIHSFSQPNSRMVLFGSKLKIQIPPLPSSPLSPIQSPKSPADFGIKTRNSNQAACLSLSPFGSVKRGSPQPECLSATEMELSEDYTRVISHGPNPKTTHIFDDCILESCCGVAKLSELKKNHSSSYSPGKPGSPPASFLSFCCTCKKNLEHGTDIYIYRGEKAFCSRECRCQEMLLDGVENPDSDGPFRTCS